MTTMSNDPEGWPPMWVVRDRAEGGRRLAVELAHLSDTRPVVVALPRGGVPVAAEIARAFDAPLEVLPVRKVGLPGHAELGIGAVAPGNVLILDEDAVRSFGVPEAAVQRVIEQERMELARRMQLYRGDRRLPRLDSRTVIVVDDGLATGVTARAAIAAARALGATSIVFAVPVCAPESAAELRREVDEVVCLAEPPNFRAVGLWYADFHPTTDDDVLSALQHARSVNDEANEGQEGRS